MNISAKLMWSGQDTAYVYLYTQVSVNAHEYKQYTVQVRTNISFSLLCQRAKLGKQNKINPEGKHFFSLQNPSGVLILYMP